MQILFLADLHLGVYSINGALRQIEAMLRESVAEVIVVAGDICLLQKSSEYLPRLKSLAPEKTWAICLGNHDYWIDDRPPKTLAQIRRDYWIPACRKSGITLLDESNLVLEEIIITGGYGHYDLGMRIEGLVEGGIEPTLAHYHSGIPPSGRVTWNDFHYFKAEPLAQIADEERRAIVNRLDVAISTGQRVIVATHGIPFVELNGHEPSFLNAYNGNAALGQEIVARSAEIELLVCGHTHRQIRDDVRHGLRCLNIGSDYGVVRGVLYDTQTKLLTWLGAAV